MDKFICTHCNYSLTIKKANETKIVKLTTPSEFINATKNEEPIEYDIQIDKPTLEAYLVKNTKIKNELKKKYLEDFDRMNSKKRTTAKYILQCSTCGSNYHLEPETVIYSLNFKKQQSTFDDDNLELKLNDPTLPRTKDYICTNESCETNKKNYDMSKKEAVFFRANGSFHTKYACTVCKTSWHI